MTRQLALPLPFAASADARDVIADSSNEAAQRWLAKPEAWPLGRLALFGAAGHGKTHLARAAAARFGWRWLDGMGLRGLPAPALQGSVMDDADCVADEAALLHVINLCAERGETLLLIGREAPARWPVRLPDLASRLRAIQAVGIGAASDAMLSALLIKFFADRQLRVEPDVQAWLIARLPRDAASLAEAVARLDHAALGAGGRITRALVRLSLGAWLQGQGVCDDSETVGRLPSPSPAPLL
ncbi:MAG: chromosomal replication initiator DnaA [Alphaproteobacteria bacterium]|nr:chromosomal replication initiator DnaA [Alphaproteobacteria bacterium]